MSILDFYEPYRFYPLQRRWDDGNGETGREDFKRQSFENYLRNIFNRDPYSGDNGHSVAEERCNFFSVIDPETKVVKAYGVQVNYAPFKKADINIEINDQNLIVSVGMSEARGGSKGTREFHYRGINGEPFRFTIPFREICYWNTECEIDENAIKASTDEGILEIIFPVASKTVNRKVPLS